MYIYSKGLGIVKTLEVVHFFVYSVSKSGIFMTKRNELLYVVLTFVELCFVSLLGGFTLSLVELFK